MNSLKTLCIFRSPNLLLLQLTPIMLTYVTVLPVSPFIGKLDIFLKSSLPPAHRRYHGKYNILSRPPVYSANIRLQKNPCSCQPSDWQTVLYHAWAPWI